MKLSKFINRKLAVTLYKDTEYELQVGFYPSHLNEELLQRVDEVGESGTTEEKLSVNSEWLLQMLAEWNLTAEDGKTPETITTENIRALGVVVQADLINAISEALGLGEASKKG